MKIGIGLPANNPDLLYDWARKAEAANFATLCVYDRLAWTNPEALVTLAALAGATTTIGLQTQILVGPLRATPLLGAQAASLDRLSGGRFTLGIGVGDRDSDFTAAGVEMKGRGRVFDQQITDLQHQWAGTPQIGPTPATPGGPPILIGAIAEKAIARIAKYGLGLINALPPEMAGGIVETANRQWTDAGRDGVPRIVGQLNSALGGDDVISEASGALSHYYQFNGMSQFQVEHMATTPRQVCDALTAYEDLGITEVNLFAWSTDASQIDRIAEATA